MSASERLIGPVTLSDAHLLSPMADVDAAADRLAEHRADTTDPVWFLERIPVDQVDRDAVIRTPDQVQFHRIKALREAVTRGRAAPLVLVHDPDLDPARGEFAVIDGRLRFNSALAARTQIALAWVAHLRGCCPLGRRRVTRLGG